MSAIIDLGPELLVDASRVRDPYVRLLLAAAGQALAGGSPWLAVDKEAAAGLGLSWDTATVGPKHLYCSGHTRNTQHHSAAMAHGHARRLSARVAQ